MKMEFIIAVLVTAAVLAPSYGREKEQIESELSEAKSALNVLVWQQTPKMQEKYLIDNPEYQTLLAAEVAAGEVRQNFLDEETRHYPEGEIMLSELVMLREEKAALPRSQTQRHALLSNEIAALGKQLDSFQLENSIKSWANPEYRRVTSPFQKAVSERFEKTLQLLMDNGSEEALAFVAEIKSAREKVEELETELRGISLE